MVQRALAALMALILLLGQLQPAAAAMMNDSDSSQEPSVQCAQEQEEASQARKEKEEKEEKEKEKAEETESKADADEDREEACPEPDEPESEEVPEASEAEEAADEDGEEEDEEESGEASHPSAGHGSREETPDSDRPETEEQTITAQFVEEEQPEECSITISGELPEDAEIVAADAAEEAVEAGVEHIVCAYDITINDGWQPEEAVEVSIANEQISGNVRVYHLNEKGKPEQVEVRRSEDGRVVFPAEGFSIYVVTDDLCRRTYEFRDYNLGNYDHYDFRLNLPNLSETENHGLITTNRQILRNGDTLVVPSLPNKNDMRFLGWYTSPNEDLNKLSPERGGVKKDITTDSIVTLYARYGKFLTLTFYARPQGAADNQVFNTQTVILSENASSVEMDLTKLLYPDSPEGLGFVGWKEEAPDENTQAPLIADPEHYLLSQNVSLYPSFEELREVSFEPVADNEEYITSVWVTPDGFTGRITEDNPTRPGYSFAGWQVGDVTLTDANSQLLQTTLSFPGGTLTNGVLHLDRDITLHSTWEPDLVNYRVCFWQEKPVDAKKLVKNGDTWEVPEAQRSYDFVSTVDVEARSGSTITEDVLRSMYSDLNNDPSPIANGNMSVSFTGMHFNSIKNSVDSDGFTPFTVSGDGSSLVHVYYDRDVVFLRFNFPEDVSTQQNVAEPEYSPVLPASGTVTQYAVTAISKANYPADMNFIGLYGSSISDGKTDSGESAQWPTSYTVSGLSYTQSTRTMQYSGGNWVQKSISSSQVTENSRTFATRWYNDAGDMVEYQEYFGASASLTPVHTLENLRQTGKDWTVSYYRENEQGSYSGTPTHSFGALSGDNIVINVPFFGYELDYFTYTDSKGTPIRRESNATAAEKTLTGGSFTNLKVYCKRKVHGLYFHNDSDVLPDVASVKYDTSLATDYVKQFTLTPDLPAQYANQADEMEFIGWFMDPELTVYVDFAGLKLSDRAKLKLQYDNIREISSVYDYRNEAGQSVGALKMGDYDLHLFAGWVKRRVLVQLEPDGGELPSMIPTFFWEEIGKTLSDFPISRNYVPWEQGQQPYVYHIHTYEQAQMDNDISDRTARYLSAGDGETGTLYAYQPDSYRFLGWFQVETLPNGNEVLVPFDHETPLTGDLTLRAQWSRKGVYSVTYSEGEHGKLSSTPGKATYRDHATIALNGNVTADLGYVFTGWKVRKPNGNGEFLDQLYSSGDELVINADWAETTMDEYTGEPRGVITLVAQYQPLCGTSVAYYANGGTFVGPGEEELAADPDLAYELQEKLVRDYGEMAQHHFIYDRSSTIVGYAISGIEQNANLTTEDGSWFQRSGYKLMGWSSTPDGPVELELHVGGYNAATDPGCTGHVLYAVWKPEKQVTFNLQGGTWNTANGPEYRQEGENWIYGAGNGETAPMPYSPTKTGYAFAGWSRSNNAKKGMAAMPSVTGNFTLYAVWTTNVALRFELNGGEWESVPSGLVLLDRNCYGTTVTPGSQHTLISDTPVREGGYLFDKWEQGSYQYSPGESIRTSAEQTGQSLTLTAHWTEGASALEVLVHADDTITVLESEHLVGTAEDGSTIPPREIEGYQFLYAVYDDAPDEKADLVEHYRVTSIHRLSEDSYQVTRANGQKKIHYPGSAEKLLAIYVQDRPVDVNLVRMNVFEDGMDNMNLTLTALKTEPYTQLSVGKVDIQAALPSPNNYAKVGSTAYRSYTYAIGRQNAENMYAIDTMTKTKLWIRQTLNGYAFSVNGNEWKDLDRESGNGKDVSVYIIYDNRVETPTTISHTVYGLKSDKEKLFTYQVYVKGRWGFNIGTGAYFLNKPDDPSENLNSYTVALHDGEKVLIPLHIDYISQQNQSYSPGDLFYDMFGNDNPTRSTGKAEKRIWQEVEMRRTNELPFEKGSFETSIQMRNVSGKNHNLFNGYDTQNHLWLKQLGISKIYTNTFSHSFIYTRKSLEVPIHVVELTRNGYELRDEEWLKDGAQTLSVTADALTVDEALANTIVTVPNDYALQSAQYGLSVDNLEGADTELVLRLASEKNDTTLLHLYDYEDASSTTRALVPDGSELYLVYYKHSSSDIPVQYVKKDTSGVYIPVDLSGYGLSTPTITVTDTESVDFRSHSEVTTLNASIEKLDAIYLTGRMMLVNQKGSVLTTYQGGRRGDWSTGRSATLLNSNQGVVYRDDSDQEQTEPLVKVWIEVASNTPLRIIGRLWQKGSMDTNTGVISFLPKDDERRIVADGTVLEIGEQFTAYQQSIPYAKDPEIDYISSSLGEQNASVYGVAYCTDEKGYRYWTSQAEQDADAEKLSQTLYADYTARYSPVSVQYVVPTETGGYAEVENMESEVSKLLVQTIQVNRSGVNVSEALESSMNSINTKSRLYRTAGTFVLGSADLTRISYTSDTADMTLTDGIDGLTYLVQHAEGNETGTLGGEQFPDLYVVLRPIATLTVSKRIDDEGGYALWDDVFTITVTLSDTDFQWEKTVDVVKDTSLTHVSGEPEQQLVKFVNGRAEIQLKHGQSVAIPELSQGIQVTFTEQEVPVRYKVNYQVIEGAKVTEANSFVLNRHTTAAVINTSRSYTSTGEDFKDSFAYAFLLCGAGAYGLYLLFQRRRQTKS